MVFRNIIIGSQIATIIVLPIFGNIADKADARVVVPMAFFARGVVAVLFRFVESPKEWQGITLCILLVVTSLIQYLAVEVVFLRNMKSTIRGTLSGIAFFFGSAGTTMFVLLSGIYFCHLFLGVLLVASINRRKKLTIVTVVVKGEGEGRIVEVPWR